MPEMKAVERAILTLEQKGDALGQQVAKLAKRGLAEGMPLSTISKLVLPASRLCIAQDAGHAWEHQGETSYLASLV